MSGGQKSILGHISQSPVPSFTQNVTHLGLLNDFRLSVASGPCGQPGLEAGAPLTERQEDGSNVPLHHGAYIHHLTPSQHRGVSYRHRKEKGEYSA